MQHQLLTMFRNMKLLRRIEGACYRCAADELGPREMVVRLGWAPIVGMAVDSLSPLQMWGIG
jgi:hypothetical protein